MVARLPAAIVKMGTIKIIVPGIVDEVKPYSMGLVYLPTFIIKLTPSVGKHTIHRLYGIIH